MFTYHNIQKFSDTETYIYKYVIANSDKVFYMTIRELASELHVSTSTIVRFCNKIDCDGYSEFKTKIMEEQKQTAKCLPRSDLQELLRYFQGTNTGAFEEKISQGVDLIRKEIIDFIPKFQACNCTILSITNQPNSTIAKMSDWNLSYYMDLEKVHGGFNATTQVPALFLIEVLARRI